MRPLGNKILIRIERNNQKKIGNKTLEIVSDDDKQIRWKWFAEKLGPEVKGDIKEGDELILFQHTHLQGWDGCKDYRIISDQDVWGIL